MSIADFSDPWQPSGRSTWPDAGNSAEHGYMKLPGKRKMIRIRQTIYEDPGNPFQDELDAERAARNESDSPLNKPLPAQPEEVEISPTGRSFFEFDISYDPFLSRPEPDLEIQTRSLKAAHSVEPSEVSPTARTFRFDSVGNGSDYGPETREMPQTRESRTTAGMRTLSEAPAPPPVRHQYHRSMSLAIPSSPPLSNDEYLSPRRFWRRENSLPLMKEGVEEKVDTPNTVRDTKFYGFYEDLMKQYDKRQSRL